MTKDQKKKFVLAMGIAIVVIMVAVLQPFYVISEGDQVVVTRFGSIARVCTEAGLHVKLPLIEEVTTYPKRVLSIDGDSQRIPTKENQFIIVDTTSRFRITDAERFYQSFKTLDSAYNKISDIIDSSVRTVITGNRLAEIVRSSNIVNEKTTVDTVDEDALEIEGLVSVASTNENITRGRNDLCKEMTRIANTLTSEYGIELIDIVPRQIKYSDELTQSVYQRMIKERNQVAQAYRSLGEGKKAEWQGKTELELRTIKSLAYKESENIKGVADSKATAIYAQSYSRDPEFYNFWKSMESYKETLKGRAATYSTNMDYFKYLYSPNGR